MTAVAGVPREARPVREEWRRLATETANPPRFGPAMITDLPGAARRWLIHAIAPGTPLWRAAEVSMHGQIRLGQWRSFTARQVIAMPHGYIWAATARVAGLPVTGFDRLSSGTAQVNWRLLRLIPVMTAAGPDLPRSAFGRLAGEIALIPTAFRCALWTQGEHPGTAIATWRCSRASSPKHSRLVSSCRWPCRPGIHGRHQVIRHGSDKTSSGGRLLTRRPRVGAGRCPRPG